MNRSNFHTIPAFMEARRITFASDAYTFDPDKLAEFFEAEKAANAIDMRVVLHFPDYPPVDAFLILYRDGSYRVSSLSLSDID